MASKRSQAYPAFSLEYCVDFVSKVYNEYGTSSFITREEMANAVGVSEATVQMRVSSAVQYSLLDRSHGQGYKPSELFINIYKPLNSDEKKQALNIALKNPTLYKKLIDELEGTILPSSKALATILFRKHGISESASQNAAETFIENLQFSNAVDSSNHVRFNHVVSEENEPDQRDNEVDEDKPIKKAESGMPKHSDDYREINIPLTEKKKAVLLVPIDVNEKDVAIIEAQLKVIALSIE